MGCQNDISYVSSITPECGMHDINHDYIGEFAEGLRLIDGKKWAQVLDRDKVPMLYLFFTGLSKNQKNNIQTVLKCFNVVSKIKESSVLKGKYIVVGIAPEDEYKVIDGIEAAKALFYIPPKDNKINVPQQFSASPSGMN